eukprot:2983397-Pyramimonas_sp.AAC.1
MPGGRRHRAGGLRRARAAGAYLGRGHPRPVFGPGGHRLRRLLDEGPSPVRRRRDRQAGCPRAQALEVRACEGHEELGGGFHHGE